MNKRRAKSLVVFLFLLVLIVFSSLAIAQPEQYQIKLLAVQENDEGYQGSDADLYLELKEGSGRVFLDTYPLTKLDTQISTRFAKQLACKHFDLNCEKYDFIYTIKSKSSIIGGPSAGAAIAALTTIAVLDLNYDKNIAITGTINSGGIIGPVGGVKEKLEAAANINLDKVLISMANSKNQENNETKLDLIEFAEKNLSLEVNEVMDIDEVVFHLTGEQLNHKEFSIEQNKEYQEIMQSLQQLLCDRTEKIEQEILRKRIVINQSTLNISNERKENSLAAIEIEDYYSAASFCFSNNILLKNQYYSKSQAKKSEVKNLFETLKRKNLALEKKINEEKITTISDLQTLIVVKERINDVKENIERFNLSADQEEQYYLLAYAEERFYSALSWMQFFSMEGKQFVVNDKLLKDSCVSKIAEAEERYQYVGLFLTPNIITHIQEKISLGKSSLLNEEYELCLIKASQAKAEANAILSSFGVYEDNIQDYLESKKKAVERTIFENSEEGIFPILGYSYYKYADSLREQEQYTALIYLEYALEVSDLGIYFPEDEFREIPFEIKKEWIMFIEGMFAGLLIAIIIVLIKRKK
jgi:uncharacterized protein